MTDEKLPYVKEFLEEQMKNYKDASKHTLINYRIDLKHFFNYTEGNFNINIRTIKKWTDYLLNQKKEARATVNRRLSTLRSYFHYLYNEEIIDNKLGEKISFVKKESKNPKKIMPQKEIHAILDIITDVKERAICETLYATGLREEELTNLDIEHIDFENKLVAVIKGKGKKSRVVPISNTALKWIKANMGSRKKGALFMNNRNGRMGVRSIYNIVKKYFPFSPHMLRHCFATHLITRTGNMKAVSEMLGHSSMIITEQTYTHMSSEHLLDVYRNGGMDRE